MSDLWDSGDEEEQIDPSTLGPELYECCEFSETERGLELLSLGVPFTYKPPAEEGKEGDESGKSSSFSTWSCLDWAAYNGNVRLVTELLKAGAMNSYNEAVAEAKVLAERQAGSKGNNNGGGGSSGKVKRQAILMNTPLHWSATCGHLHVCWVLLRQGYSLTDPDSSGNTPLHIAASNGHAAVVRCFIEDGANVWRRNGFRNTPLEVCCDEKGRRLLKAAMENDREGSWTEKIAATRHEDHIKKLDSAEAEITGIVDTSSLNIETFEEMLGKAKDLGVSKEVMVVGDAILKKITLGRKLEKEIEDLEGAMPVVTQIAYTGFVNVLQETIAEVTELLKPEGGERAADEADVGGAETVAEGGLQDIVKRGEALCETAHSEYWLNVCVGTVAEVDCATEHTVSLMKRLKESITKAEMANGNSELVENATKVHARLSCELELGRAIENFPVVRLPDPEMDAKALKEYWQEEDTGAIEETREWPLPPEETGQYIWNPSDSLKLLRDACERLETALKGSEGCFESLVEESRKVLEEKNAELEVLEAKNDEDRDAAVAAAEKLAKKLKKGKGGKKKK